MVTCIRSIVVAAVASKSRRVAAALSVAIVGSLVISMTSNASVKAPRERHSATLPDIQISAQVLTIRAQEVNAVESGLRLARQQDSLPIELASANSSAAALDDAGDITFPSGIDKAMMATFAAPMDDDEGLSFPTDGLDLEPLLASLPRKRGQAQWQCLAEAVYFEARSESVPGQRAVAEVIMNRVKSRRFPNHVCAVVKQGADRRNKCQFSYNCDGQPEYINNARAYRLASEVARVVIEGDDGIELTDGATHYHTTYVSPFWSRKLTRTVQIGEHIFYRENARSARR